jgi:hypothetical protein
MRPGAWVLARNCAAGNRRLMRLGNRAKVACVQLKRVACSESLYGLFSSRPADLLAGVT